jgi:hypothetical protein
MAKLNWQRPNNGYEMEPWDRRRFKNQTQSEGLSKAIHEEKVFISGKYHGKSIDTIVKTDPGYCDWILENNPKGIVAQQIVKHFNKQ